MIFEDMKNTMYFGFIVFANVSNLFVHERVLSIHVLQIILVIKQERFESSTNIAIYA
jgi:hypothetical protein